jgi:hypothetical protein
MPGARARCAPGWWAVPPAKRPTRWPWPSSRRWTTLAGPERRELQIFATDLNADAIAAARTGRFEASIARDWAHAAGPLLHRTAGGYQIDKRVRDMVLFAQHDVIMDPPFTRLDIVSCRNLMIYFGSALQRRLIPLFHYSLRAWRRAAAGRGSKPWAARSSCLRRWTRSPGSTGAVTMAAQAVRWSFRPIVACSHVRPCRRPHWRIQTPPRPTCRLWPTNCCCSRMRRPPCW